MSSFTRNQALSVVVNELMQRRNGVETVGRLRAVHRPTRTSTNANRLRETHRRTTTQALHNRLYIMCIDAVSRGNVAGYYVSDRSGNTRYLEIQPTFHIVAGNNAGAIGTLTVYVSDGPDRVRDGRMFHTHILIDDPLARNVQNEELRWSRASSRRARSIRTNISFSDDDLATDILNHIRFQPRARRLTLSMAFEPTQALGVVRYYL